MFNWADYVIIGIVILSAIISLVRGFVKEALSLIVWVLAFWIALNFCTELARLLESHIETPSLRLGVGFLLLFLVVLIIGSFVNYLLGQLVKKTGLTGTDRMLGVLFGVARGIILVALLILLAGLTSIPQDPWWQNSALLPKFQGITNWLQSGDLPTYVKENFVLNFPDVAHDVLSAQSEQMQVADK